MRLLQRLVGRNPVGGARVTALVVSAMVIIVAPAAHGQQSTEQFIPIGQSPGLSGTITYAGEITGVDPGLRSLTMRRAAEGDAVTVTVASDTRIWLDRSSIGQPSLSGDFADLLPGSVVEIHFRDPERRRLADWIKVASDRVE